jgi:hypothetical protein
MPDRSSKKRPLGPPDVNSIAFRVMQEATGQAEKTGPDSLAAVTVEKNPAAVELGRLGGIKGGKARADALSPKKRKAIAKKAAKARWAKKAIDSK